MTCIHTDHDGTTWAITPEGIPTQVTGKYRPSKLLAITYRVIGVPQNYKLIISLYLALLSKEIKGRLLVGSPSVCHRYQNSSLQLLNCISVLNPHDNLPHTWHTVDSTSYRNFLLLQIKQDQIYDASTKIKDRVQHWYLQHITYPFWQFLKIEQHSDLVLDILASIVDPRWYFNVKHPNRLTRLDSHFGLMTFAKFSKFWNLRMRKKTAKLDAKQDRARLLVEAVKALPADSPLLLDIACDITNKKDVHKACKRLLHFIVRNWLAGSMEHAEFDPRVFFSNKLVKDNFLKQFGE
jgi:hypothetical protein